MVSGEWPKIGLKIIYAIENKFAFPKLKGRLVPNSSTMVLWGRIWDVTFCFVPKFRPTVHFEHFETSSAPVFYELQILQYCSELISIVLFANDTNILYSHTCLKKLNEIIQVEINKIAD